MNLLEKPPKNMPNFFQPRIYALKEPYIKNSYIEISFINMQKNKFLLIELMKCLSGYGSTTCLKSCDKVLNLMI